MMKKLHVITLIALMLLVGAVSGNVTAERTYFAEDTAIPFEIFALLIGIGVVFLILATTTGFAYNGGMTMVFGLIGALLLSAGAYAAPVTGFYSYASNTTTNATSQVTPTVWLVMQPWMAWLLWGLALISFLLFVFGILILFREKAHEEEMYWV